MKIQIIRKEGLEVVNLNRREAIHERCLNCSGWIPTDVTDCSFIKCPLHSFRTRRGKQDAKLRTKAIKGYCLWCANGQVGEVTKCPCANCSLFAYRKGGLDKAITSPSFEKIDRIGGNFRTNLIKVNIDTTQYRFRKSA